MLKHLYNLSYALVREHIVKIVARSDKWPTARKHFLASHDTCEACGSINHLQVHHKMPFHDDPTKELDPSNFITLCMDTNECHLMIGHSGSFKMFNPNVEHDAAEALKYPEKLDSIKAKALKSALPNIPGEK